MEPRPPRSLRVEANGLSLHVLAWEPPEEVAPRARAPVCVLLHGYMDAATSFDQIAPHLARAGFRVFAPDQRGFGDSAHVPAGGYYHFPDYVFDAADLLDALSPGEPVFLVGHSMGGNVAALLAGTLPERVAMLALLEGVGPPDFPDDLAPLRTRAWIDGVRKVRAKAERPFSLADAERRLASNHPYVDRALLRRRAEQLTRPLREDELAELADLADGSAPEARALRRWRFDSRHRTTSPYAFSVARWRAHAAKIDAPTLIVGGGPTGYHPPDEAARVAVIPRARVVELPDAGHMMHWTRPDALVHELLAFVAAIDAHEARRAE
jgi:pimeloyl-ACP methyl ester carboxylesterase